MKQECLQFQAFFGGLKPQIGVKWVILKRQEQTNYI